MVEAEANCQNGMKYDEILRLCDCKGFYVGDSCQYHFLFYAVLVIVIVIVIYCLVLWIRSMFERRNQHPRGLSCNALLENGMSRESSVKSKRGNSIEHPRLHSYSVTPSAPAMETAFGHDYDPPPSYTEAMQSTV
ncbi:EGF-like domain-containing protein [Caenorhabditis elegans]|uniref:EGF-like domain-containing protein n=1 Tax=Caenorhabditis elegans TaxID=6239 RepID=X5ML99_CAEEL|nr:EGF-like domain-containing protein [Caenorhabditis elegans]CDO50130.1 EGF-like domain-containing protein [Caenorhabditis elegans]|eukprot:NP_001293402.1 Uncharacterized protein CELE_Y51F10.15 [Caenorhabditis elegans]